MIKATIYPKTKRVPNAGTFVTVTEKVDGSCLCLFKLHDILYIAQRNNIYDLAEAMEMGKALYPGLHDFLDQHGMWLYENLCEGSALCGEWLGMGKIKYDWDNLFGSRFLMFAKARVTEDFRLENIQYDHANFKWALSAKKTDDTFSFDYPYLPDFIAEVPIVAFTSELPSKASLDKLYAEYTDMVKRPVEGFVCEYNNSIVKYVRMKDNKLIEYDQNAHKGE